MQNQIHAITSTTKSINTTLVCSWGKLREKENFHVNPLDRDGKITLCPSDVILDVTHQIILLNKSLLLAFLTVFYKVSFLF